MSPWLCVGVLSLLLASASCQVFRFSSIFADEMVLQMGPKKAQFFGFGLPRSRLQLSMDAGAVTVPGEVWDNATWAIKLPPQPAGGPHNITVEQIAPGFLFGSRAIVSLRDVMFGDVWVCAGEGNMEMSMRDIFNATQEMEIAQNYTRLRLVHVAHHASDVELSEPTALTLTWSPITQAAVGNFPALCLLYGERLSDALDDRLIGLVAATWQETPVEAWASSRVTEFCKTPPTSGTSKTANNALWNGMIHPLTKMTVRGAIWSQGESNVAYNTDLYTCHFREFTKDWRLTFADGNVSVTPDGWAFPFGFVQLGAMDGADPVSVSLMRSHQVFDSQVAPNHGNNETYMAPAYDLFDRLSPLGSVYYRDKQRVATRLANAARRLIYNETGLHFIGPIPSIRWDYETSIMNVTYSWDIRILNKVGEPSGFSYKDPSGEWVEAPLFDVFEDTLSFYVHPNYTHVAYAWSARPCDYLKCNVYSASPHDLPHTTTFFPPWEPPEEQTTTTLEPEDEVTRQRDELFEK